MVARPPFCISRLLTRNRKIVLASLNSNLKLGANRGNLLINIIYRVYDKKILLKITKKIVAKLKV